VGGGGGQRPAAWSYLRQQKNPTPIHRSTPDSVNGWVAGEISNSAGGRASLRPTSNRALAAPLAFTVQSQAV